MSTTISNAEPERFNFKEARKKLREVPEIPPGRPAFIIKATLATIAGFPFVIVGSFLCATIILSPIGLIVLGMAGWPLYKVIQHRMEFVYAWERRNRPLSAEENDARGGPPWLN